MLLHGQTAISSVKNATINVSVQPNQASSIDRAGSPEDGTVRVRVLSHALVLAGCES